MMWGWGGNFGTGGWIVMGLMMLLVWGGIATLVVLLLRGNHSLGRGSKGHPMIPSVSSMSGSPGERSTKQNSRLAGLLSGAENDPLSHRRQGTGGVQTQSRISGRSSKCSRM
jgi:hypothetical protein